MLGLGLNDAAWLGSRSATEPPPASNSRSAAWPLFISGCLISVIIEGPADLRVILLGVTGGSWNAVFFFSFFLFWSFTTHYLCCNLSLFCSSTLRRLKVICDLCEVELPRLCSTVFDIFSAFWRLNIPLNRARDLRRFIVLKVAPVCEISMHPRSAPWSYDGMLQRDNVASVPSIMKLWQLDVCPCLGRTHVNHLPHPPGPCH